MRPVRAASIGIAFLLVLVSPASATYETVGSGVTRLTLDRGFMATLSKEGIELEARDSARLRGRTVSFPISSGKFDPTNGKGALNHRGELVLRAAGRSVRVTSLMLRTTRRSTPFSAKIGGGQLKLATAAGLVVKRAGFGDAVRAGSLRLSDKVATRLEKRLGVPGAFPAGQLLGSAVTRAVPSEIAVQSKTRASLTLDPGLVEKLDRLFVAVNPIFPAEHVGPLFTLPLGSGTVAPDGGSGKLKLSGSMEFLQLGGGQVFWEDPWLDLGLSAGLAEADVQPSPPYPGRLPRAPVWDFDPAMLSTEAKAAQRSVALAVPLMFDAATAAYFNEAFAGGATEFQAGEAVGNLTLRAVGQ